MVENREPTQAGDRAQPSDGAPATERSAAERSPHQVLVRNPVIDGADEVDAQEVPRLLAVDDSVLIHRLLKARLRHERLEIHSASCGKAGLAMAHELHPDVILLDVAMPDIDGFEVLMELKSDPDLHDIPVIFLSGSSDTTDRVRALEMGATDFITKPFEIIELRARVRSALRISALIKLLAKRAQVDSLTGLANRSYFDSRLAQETAEADRHGRDLALVMIDIDHFKPINDTHGHPFGDVVLEQFGRLLEQGRGGDIACRYGGEEFAIIMPDTDVEGAQAVSERLRQTLRDERWPEHRDMQITASFGVADLSQCASTSPAAMVELADRALYEAKRQGRDRVVIAVPASCPPQGKMRLIG